MPRSIALVLLMLAGCFNPDDIFPVHGSVTSIDPVEGQVVRLLRDTAPALGPSCTDAQPFKETTVDAAGNFSFDVFRAQAMKLTGGSPFCFRVETTFPSGSTVSSELLAISGEETLPAFPDWRAQPSRVDGVLRFEPVQPLPAVESFEGPQLAHRAQWHTEDGGLAWAADDLVSAFDPVTMSLVPTRAPLQVDDFALEDFSGTAVLHARLTIIGTEENVFGNRSAHTLELKSGDTLALAGHRAPISRGISCAPYADPCPLTDGALTPVDAGVITGTNSLMTFTLPAPTVLTAIVLRSVETDTLLMGVQLLDADGGALALVQQELPSSLWNASVPSFMVRQRSDGGVEFAPRADPHFITIALDAGVSVSAVRIGFAGGVESWSEVSFFE